MLFLPPSFRHHLIGLYDVAKIGFGVPEAIIL
jgi:hypothetical protein